MRYTCPATTILILTLAFVVSADLPTTGIVTYSRGDGGNRTLYRRVITNGQLASEEKICNKGSAGGDIQGVISHDGKVLAFSRSMGGTSGSYGGDDYHDHHRWDIYVVPLTGSLPAAPKKVGHGYFPCWGDDSHGTAKTLYYSVYESTEIWKATISASGDVSNVTKHHGGGGYNHTMMMPSPDGNMIAYRDGPNMRIYHHAGANAGKSFDAGGGCMPNWMANSRWLIHAKATISRNDGQHQKYKYFERSLGSYHLGSSVDMKWLISRTAMDSYDKQNLGLTVKVTPITVTDNDWVAHVDKQTTITNDGSWVDIHAGATEPPKVAVDAFWAEPASITPGASTTLKWTVKFATAVKLDGQTVTGTSKSVSPSSTTTYTLTAEGNGGPITKTLEVTVTAPVLTTIEVSPSATKVDLGKTIELTAQTLDQIGEPIDATVSWKVEGPGSVSPASGLSTVYTAPAAEAGPAVIVASSGTVTQRTTVTVIDPNALRMKINCGDNALAVAGWEPDDPYVTGGEDWTNPNTISVNGVEDAAPADVYKTVRHQDHSYSFDIDDGDYLLRIHFADAYGDRQMTYVVEAKTVLENFDPVTAAGGANKAVVKEFPVTVADGNGLQIDCSGSGDVFEAGIEIIGAGSTMPPQTIEVSSPAVDESYGTGQKLTIAWRASSDVSSVMLELSLDGGKTFLSITDTQVARSDAAWGSFEWTVADELVGTTVKSTQAMVRVTDYLKPTTTGQSGQFSLNAEPAAVGVGSKVFAGGARARVSRRGSVLSLVPPATGAASLEVFRLDGSVVGRVAGTQAATVRLRSTGAYIARTRHKAKQTTKAHVVVSSPE